MDLQAIAATRLGDEDTCVSNLLAQPAYDMETAQRIGARAALWVRELRQDHDRQTLLDSFLGEYGLNNEEGVALMCLAEAFLRVPDARTAGELLEDKLADKNWAGHAGHAESWLVNSSTWALMLTGRTLRLESTRDADAWLNTLLAKLGQPVLQRAVRAAMQIMGDEFVLGEDIDTAMRRSDMEYAHYSYDMLGEGARDRASAETYRDAYADAIEKVGTGPAGNSISVKLSALHPRYTPLQASRVLPELSGTVLELCRLARSCGVAVTIDAEEAQRLVLSLQIVQNVLADPSLKGWDDLGVVVQAYNKRAPQVIDWLSELMRASGRRMPVRLVKGAYWDAEIKHAQEAGLAGFPVYTRKATTDVAYLHCAHKLLAANDRLQAQFATHNAHTVAAVIELAQNKPFECQRLHGMGEHLYDVVRDAFPDLQLRVYAPVGQHRDLLAYLVRRLLENGANSSFVNRLHNDALEPEALVADPYASVRDFTQRRHPHIRLPRDLFAGRENSVGVDVCDETALAATLPGDWQTAGATQHSASPVAADEGQPTDIVGPANGQPLAAVVAFPVERVDEAMAHAGAAWIAWRDSPLAQRVACLRRVADALEAHRAELHRYLCHEAGKTWQDASDEVREAVDFCRYYALRAEESLAPQVLPGPTGEHNELRLRGRGVFVCISPWNFPLAIFTGQVVAALVSGNCVVAKPAEWTPLIALLVARLCHEAGIPEGVLQVLVGGADLGAALVGHRACAGVAFTGSTGVAREINRSLAARDDAIVPLIAETGGQNAMLVDSTALLEQVTDDVVRSAFGSAGQRCSALRVLFIQDDVAEDALTMIRGAMQELIVGPPEDTTTDIGPIISAGARARLQAHVSACAERGCAVFTSHPRLPAAGHYLSPSLIELGSLSELQAEQFGPILHVVRFAAGEIDEVIEQINATGYALTFGVHTRIERRSAYAARMIRAGNVYVNRNMTGAVVGAQPFGGQGRSGTGPKAGGPHYLLRFTAEQTVSVNTTAAGGNVALLAGE